MKDDVISRQAAIDAAEKESQADGAYGYMDTKSIVDLLNDLPSIQPEIIRCKDCRYYKTYQSLTAYGSFFRSAVLTIFMLQKMIIAAERKGKPMEAIDVLKYLLAKAESEVPEGHRIVELNVPVDIVREIIDAQPERKTGKWSVYDRHTIPYQFICSECGAYHRAMYDFCPNCGADMRGDAE